MSHKNNWSQWCTKQLTNFSLFVPLQPASYGKKVSNISSGSNRNFDIENASTKLLDVYENLSNLTEISLHVQNGLWQQSPGNQGWGGNRSRKSSVIDADNLPSTSLKPSAGRVIRIINNNDQSVQVSPISFPNSFPRPLTGGYMICANCRSFLLDWELSNSNLISAIDWYAKRYETRREILQFKVPSGEVKIYISCVFVSTNTRHEKQIFFIKSMENLHNI